MTKSQSALFIDFENVVISAQKIDELEDQSRPFKIKPILEFIENKFDQKPILRLAYADWRNPMFSIYTAELFRHGVEMKHIPHHGIMHKNAADMYITVDAMECLKAFPDIHRYFIVSGDSDFTPLINKLREYSKTTVGCGIKPTTSNLLVQSCDDFYYYLTVLMEMGYLIPNKHDKQKRKRKSRDIKSLRKIVSKIFYKHESKTLRFSRLKDRIRREVPDFAEWQFGYSRFGVLMDDLIKIIPNLTIEKDEHGHPLAVWKGDLAHNSAALSEVKEASREKKERWQILFEQLRQERKFITDPANRKQALEKVYSYIKNEDHYRINELFNFLKQKMQDESHQDLMGTVLTLYYSQIFDIHPEDRGKDLMERRLALKNRSMRLTKFLRNYYRSLLYKQVVEQQMKWTPEECAMAFMYTDESGTVQFFQEVLEQLS